MKKLLSCLLAFVAVLGGGAVKIVQDQCGPFADVTPGFCPYVLELYYLGITVGTSATTFSPDDPLTRGQAAVFVSKGLNQSLARSSRRAALGRWWTTRTEDTLARTRVGPTPVAVESDGADLWVADGNDGTVSRVRGSDGRLLETWTGAGGATDVLVAAGRIFILNYGGVLSMIDPSQPPGAVTPVASGFKEARAMAFDGARIWIVNGGISIVTPGPTLPWAVETIVILYLQTLGILFDGRNIWTSGEFFAIAGELRKFDASGASLQTVTVGQGPYSPTFDGSNIWVLNVGGAEQSVSVVQAATGAVVATLTGNGMQGGPYGAAFDGERVLVTTFAGLSLWNAASLTPVGSLTLGPGNFPLGVCSDGFHFWITMFDAGALARF